MTRRHRQSAPASGRAESVTNAERRLSSLDRSELVSSARLRLPRLSYSLPELFGLLGNIPRVLLGLLRNALGGVQRLTELR